MTEERGLAVSEKVISLGSDAELVYLEVHCRLQVGQLGPSLEDLGHREVGDQLAMA